MPRKEKKYHFIYKTTNLLSGKYYIGMHSTDNLEDGYMGSGKRLRYSLNKYGKENHKVEILEFFDSREKLVEREKEIVNLNEIAKEKCMNLVVGGYGGENFICGFKNAEHMLKCSSAGKKALISKLKLDENFRLKFSNKISSARKRELKFNLRPNFNCDWTGKKHLESTIIKMREKKLGTGVKEANSQYGTCWITNGVENKKIKLVDLDNYSNSEWFRGRT